MYHIMVSFSVASLRYLRRDGRMSTVTFNNLKLADGEKHRLLFHLKGLEVGGPRAFPQGQGVIPVPGVELHVDCRLVETLRDLPAVFNGLNSHQGVELKTMQGKAQVCDTFNGCKQADVFFTCWYEWPLWFVFWWAGGVGGAQTGVRWYDGKCCITSGLSHSSEWLRTDFR